MKDYMYAIFFIYCACFIFCCATATRLNAAPSIGESEALRRSPQTQSGGSGISQVMAELTRQNGHLNTSTMPVGTAGDYEKFINRPRSAKLQSTTYPVNKTISQRYLFFIFWRKRLLKRAWRSFQ